MSLLQMEHVSKSFAKNLVLNNVDFTVERGEIHALLGENGAGKSTLLNILAGVLPADSGTIIFDGVTYDRPTITQMEKDGLAFVHQELNVINDLTVSENMFFHREVTRGLGMLNKKEMVRQTRTLFEELDVDIDPTALVADLKASQKQLLEICRALHTNAKLMILDEPTTALGTDEVKHLFSILRRLKENGTSLVFVSHKMPEIFEIADRYTVLRNGELIQTGAIADVSPREMTTAMVGEQYVDRQIYEVRELGEPVLEAKGLSGRGFRSVDLTVRRGEILALTGLAGSGASELLQTMFGALPITGGTLYANDKPISGNIGSFMRRHVGMLPTDRKENSVIPDASVIENQYLAQHSLRRLPRMIHRKVELERYEALKKMLNIKAQSPDMPVTSLSGGNQQKVFFARWLNIDSNILLLDNPTQGVDVGAKEEIYGLILDLARQGKTIVLNTLEIPEIMKVCDRCVVLYSGEVAAVFDHDDINEHDVMLYSTSAVNVGQEK